MGRFTSNAVTVLRFSGARFLTLGISTVKGALHMPNYIANLTILHDRVFSRVLSSPFLVCFLERAVLIVTEPTLVTEN